MILSPCVLALPPHPPPSPLWPQCPRLARSPQECRAAQRYPLLPGIRVDPPPLGLSPGDGGGADQACGFCYSSPACSPSLVFRRGSGGGGGGTERHLDRLPPAPAPTGSLQLRLLPLTGTRPQALGHRHSHHPAQQPGWSPACSRCPWLTRVLAPLTARPAETCAWSTRPC